MCVGVVTNGSNNTKAIPVQISRGTLHTGQMIVFGKDYGTITNITDDQNKELQKATSPQKVFIEGLTDVPSPGTEFKVFSNLWAINIYFLLETLIIFYLFFFYFREQKILKLLISIFAASLLLIWLIRNIIFDKIYSFDSMDNGIESICVILLSVIFFYQQLTKPHEYFVYNSSTFWMIAGILIYKAGTFFLFLYFTTLEQSEKDAFGNYYIINSAFLMLRNIFFTIAFIVQKDGNSKKNHFKSIS